MKIFKDTRNTVHKSNDSYIQYCYKYTVSNETAKINNLFFIGLLLIYKDMHSISLHLLWGRILAVSSFPKFLIENRIGDYWIGYQTLGLIGVKKSDRKTIASYFFSFLI